MALRRILSIVTFIIVSLLITSSAYANSPFTDISTDCEYYGAILDLYNRGIIIGNGDGLFRPDANLTKAEQDVMLTRAFSDDGVAWINASEEPITIAEFCLELLNRANYRPYLPSYNVIPEVQILRAASILCRPQYAWRYFDTTTYIKRIEAANAISRILSYDSLDMPSLSEKLRLEVHDVIPDQTIMLAEQTINDMLLYIARLPQNIIDQFYERGYKVTVDSNKVASSDTFRVAFIDYDDKEICINVDLNSSAILHEFGHFYEYYMNSDYKVVDNHIDEFEGLYLQSLLRDYAGLNQAEYFAEYFSLWFLESTNSPSKRTAMYKFGSKTFNWFRNLEAADWPMKTVE